MRDRAVAKDLMCDELKRSDAHRPKVGKDSVERVTGHQFGAHVPVKRYR